MTKIVLFHHLAAREYVAAHRWYARRSPAAAQRFREAIDRVVERLESDPEQGTPFRDSFRWMRTRRFPYLLYYEIFDPGPIWVYAVAHSRRRPGYWLRRTGS
jgi:plasmid stabilization system protein ParE